jgi:hypothetical protein
MGAFEISGDVNFAKEKTPESETKLKIQALTHDPKLR